MRMSSRKTRVAAVTVLGLAVMATAVSAEEEPKGPDATVKLSGNSVALGLGYAWGSGVLTYKGKEYRFKIKGLTAGAVGATSIDVTGDVFHLKGIEDFAGTYAGFTTEATVGGGVDFSIMKNGSGVYIELHGTSMGLLFQAGPAGINLVMDSEYTTSR
jgi:hypothetical protein